jgi:UDP-N-acetylglucosamine--N-acetylmuramyl-(pentapeptide) pyrophosphoryl-undecaprenol N-acetylglucosamine transferase
MTVIQKPYKIIISGGGTGGHIYPAIAIAHALRELLVDVEILFVGAKGKMEMQKVPEAGYPIIGLWISGLQRKITFDNLAFPFKVVSSLVKSWFILRRFKPNAVVGVGGYASGPLLFAATLSSIPALIQEQNSYAGLTNKWLANRVNKICVAYHKMDRFFPKNKLVFTGNPVRSDILDISDKRNAALKKFDLDRSKKTVLVLGGSLGARTLNESLLNGLNQLVESGVQVIWQTGQFYFEEMKRRTADQAISGIQIMPFIKEMDLAYAAADVVVSRAGALSISELCLVAKPVVFVPSTNVAEDHQTKNALAVVENMGALMVKDADAVQNLIPIVINLLGDADQQLKLSTNISKLAMPQAAKMIAEEIKLLIA